MARGRAAAVVALLLSIGVVAAACVTATGESSGSRRIAEASVRPSATVEAAVAEATELAAASPAQAASREPAAVPAIQNGDWVTVTGRLKPGVLGLGGRTLWPATLNDCRCPEFGIDPMT